jgi:acetyltransferase-like isoleucine patch superfamily enzyme
MIVPHGGTIVQRLTTDAGTAPLPMMGGEFGTLRVTRDDAGGNILAGHPVAGRNSTLAFESLHNAGTGNLIEFGRDVRFDDVSIMFRGEGCRLTIGEGARLTGRITISGIGSICEIGAQTTVERFGIVCNEGSAVILGPRCMVSYNVEIRNTDSHSIFDAATGERINSAADVIVGEHVWLGAHSLICKGVSIARDVVVGQGSVVTKSIERPNCIVAGNPARVVRTGIAWDSRLLSALA